MAPESTIHMPRNTNLIRDSDGKPSATRYNLNAVLRDATGDMPLLPYDIVFVPMSAIARVDEFVNHLLSPLRSF